MPNLKYILLLIFFTCAKVGLCQLPDSLVKPPFAATPVSGGGGPVCGTDLLLQQLRQAPGFLKKEELMNLEISQAVQLHSGDTVVLPIVFHILADDPYSITDQVIIDGLKDLNDAFAKRGAWSGSKGVDTKIRFCLAKKDPEGGNATGITRVVTQWGNHVSPLTEDSKMKATALWDPSRYINVWFVRSINSEAMAEFRCGVWTRLGVAGYATLPPGGGPTDGIVTTGFGLILAHEMGHYLGLYHTFEGYCFNNNCLLNGDRVCDTPPDGSYRPSSCSSPENSCNTDTLSGYSNGNFTTNVPDPVENFMDYGNTACQNTFTQGQADRMLNAINTQRKGLLEPKCDQPCTDNVFAVFKRNIANPVAGDEVEFQNTSVDAVSYQWFVDGVQVSTSQNLLYKFNQTGRFRVTLKAFKNNNCYGSFSEYVIVNCGVSARFYTNKHAIASQQIIYEDTIFFTNNSVGANDYKWLIANDKGMSEQVVSTAKDLAYMFAVPANYTIRLIASNNNCIDTTDMYRLAVADPTPDGTVFLTSVHCYQQTKIRVEFFVCNNSYDTIPAGTPISFYNSDPRLAGAQKVGGTFRLPSALQGLCCSFMYSYIVDVGYPGLNEIWISLNDTGTTSAPLIMPNTGMAEKDYANNLRVVKNFQLKATPIPASTIMEPGDTIKLNVIAGPGNITSYRWASADRMSCTNCQSPNYIADTSETTIKEVIVTSVFSCSDTAYVNITVPPYNDFRMQIDSADCTNTDSIRVHFTIFNDFKRGILPKGLTIRFFDGDPKLAGSNPLLPTLTLTDSIQKQIESFSLNIKGRTNGAIFAIINDGSGLPPVVLPNTNFEEKNYSNNTTSYNYTRLKVSTTALTGLIEPGDTIRLEASAGPGTVKSYTWSTDYNLSCSICQFPDLFADTTTTKRVIAENLFGCRDTAYLQVNIPPADDFTISLDETACAANDSMFVGFTISNLFRRGYLPKGLTIQFYDADPRQAGAVSLLPPFILSQDYLVKTQSFSTFIKNSTTGKLYAVVNDSGTVSPLVLPSSKRLEKDYSNNIVQVNYTPETLILSPQDTTITRGSSFTASIASVLFNPSATQWSTGQGYTLSCTSCPAPVVTAQQPSLIAVTSPNRYGCLLKGSLNVKILPPDFTLSITSTACLNSQTTRVSFSVCMNNGYDTVWNGIPVTFYDGDPSTAGANILQTVFVTPVRVAANCANYVHNISTPSGNALFARVNDRGIASTPGADIVFDETDPLNNIAEANGYKKFALIVDPLDTTIERSGTIQIFTTAEGGTLQSVKWTPNPFLSCTNCFNPVVNPSYTDRYMVIGQNENQCRDTAVVTIRTVTIGDIYIPSAFTPNADRLNDIFYIMGSERVITIKDFIIYTRWGEKVFEAHDVPPNDPLFGWNGLNKGIKAESGAYVYQVNALMIDGKNEIRKGTIMLIR